MKFVVTFLLLFLSMTIASENIFFSGQYRGRFDNYSGVNKNAYGDKSIDSKANIKGKSNDSIYLQQIIGGITYRPNSNLEYKLHMYDSRAWGYSAKNNFFLKNTNTLDEYMMHFYDDHAELFEAYIKSKNFIHPKLTVTLGRQQLGYGDRRIFGPGKWGNTMGWLWDAAHLSFKDKKDFVDVWYGQTRIKEQNDFSIVNRHRYQGVGLYSHFETEYGNLEPFASWRNTMYDKVSSIENSYYLGMRFFNYKNSFIYDATAVKAFGKIGSLDIDTYAYALKAGMKFDTKYHTKLIAGYIYASGDDNPIDNKSRTFITPFGANDGLHYGRMDIMFWRNMSDLQFSLNMKPTKRTELEFAYHNFHLAKESDKWYGFNYVNKVGNSYSHIGDEYDVIVKHSLTSDIKLLVIFGYLNAGDFIKRNSIADNDSSKLFLQFTYSFNSKY